MKYIIIVIFLISFASCSKKTIQNSMNKKDDIDFFDPIIFNSQGLNTTLNINAQFSECGEFGGHKEIMKIYTKERNQFFLDYKKFSLKCNENKNEEIVYMKTIEVNKNEKKSIIEYIHRMIDSKIRERNDSNAANIFSIISSDSTFTIEVYDLNDNNIKSYNTLLNNLQLQK